MRYKVSKTTLISELIQKSPRVADLLLDRGLSCATCFMNQFESIEAGAKLHGMTDKEVECLLGDINKALKDQKV